MGWVDTKSHLPNKESDQIFHPLFGSKHLERVWLVWVFVRVMIIKFLSHMVYFVLINDIAGDNEIQS